MPVNAKLFMILLGCRPKGRLTEQHDIFFGIAKQLKDIIPSIHDFWPDAKNNIHIDVWSELTYVQPYTINVVSRNTPVNDLETNNKLFFINLGGYRKREFEEYHHKKLVVAPDKGVAIQKSKETTFYQHTGFAGANTHIDDKFGVDVDDIFEIEDILPASMKASFRLQISESKPDDLNLEDEMHIGYLRLNKIKENAFLREDAKTWGRGDNLNDGS